MKMSREVLRYVIVLFAISLCSLFAATGTGEENDARELARFEADWLTANLNGDGQWLERLVAAKHGIQPASRQSVVERETFTKQILAVDVPDGAMKVRITGVISFLTNDPAKNRSFNFLDTFNRKGGKWELIASSFAQTNAAASTSEEQIEKDIRRLETEAAKAILEKDEAAVARFFTEDSVTNDPRNGLTRGYSEVVNAIRTGLINYYSFDRTVESVQVLGETVVVMGNETVIGKNARGGPGETIKRRFTNVWMKPRQNWQIVARHASVIAST